MFENKLYIIFLVLRIFKNLLKRLRGRLARKDKQVVIRRMNTSLNTEKKYNNKKNKES